MIFHDKDKVGMREVTRYFKVYITDIETWMSEGTFPMCYWENGRRYWESQVILDYLESVDSLSSSSQADPDRFGKYFYLQVVCVAIIVHQAMNIFF
jgi:hypothetical protein